MFGNHEYESIISRAFDEAIRQAVREVIADNIGSGVESEIKSSIKKFAEDMLKNDKALRDSVRERLIYWIGRQ